MTEAAGTWLRVSTSGQDEENQLPDNMRWIESHGYRLAATYQVHGRSAFKGNRKFDQAWAQVLADLKAGKIRVLVVWKQDRLDRKLETFQMLKQVVEAGGRVEFVTQPHLNDLTTMGGRISLKVQEEIAHAESKDKSDRIIAKHEALRSKNSLTGRPSFGYAVQETGDRKTLVPAAEGLAYVPLIFAMVIAGKSLADIAAWLRLMHAGCQHPAAPHVCREWWPRTVGALVRNPVYIGHRADASGKTILRCEGMVDANVFRTAGEALDGRPKRGPVRIENRAQLAGVLFCPDCQESPMHRINCGNTRKDGTKTVNYYYRCAGRGALRKGCGNMVLLTAADARFGGWLAANLGDLPVVEATLVPGTDHAAELEAIRFEIRQLAAQDLSDDEYDARLRRLRAERDRVAGLPKTEDSWKLHRTGEMHTDRLAALPAAERPAYLRDELKIRVTARRDADAPGGVRMDVQFGALEEYQELCFTETQLMLGTPN